MSTEQPLPALDTRRDAEYFLELQANTGWGRVLSRFVSWIAPQPGWLALDVGCGPGLLPALLERAGCRALGCDLDPDMFRPEPLHGRVLVADARRLPFPAGSFDLLTASNLLFLLPDAEQVLQTLVPLLHPGGQLCLLNPSEHLSVAAASQLAIERGLTGLARQTLLNWAARAEATCRWTESETAAQLSRTGLVLLATKTQMGPGFARFSRAARKEHPS